MATVATTQQTREAILVDGKTKFKITIWTTAQGPLPSMAIFAIQINDPEDPKADTFGRVVDITDFSLYGEDRAQAVLNQQAFYRLSQWVFYYDDLTTAVNATDVLKTRIDEMVTEWETYDTQFETITETTEHPRTGLDTFNTLVAAYDSAVAAEASALTARDDAKSTYDAAVVDAAAATNDVTHAQTVYNECVASKGYFDACLAALTALCGQSTTFSATGTGAGIFLTNSKTFRDAADVLRAACTADPPNAGQKAAYDAAVATYNSQVSAMDTTIATFRNDVTLANTAQSTALTNQTLFAGYCTNRQTELTNAQTAKTNADTAVANARTAYASAQAAYESAQMATEAALAAVRALKPTWTPATPLSGSSTTV